MQAFLKFPQLQQLKPLLAKVKTRSYTYPEVGASQDKSVSGYDNDLQKIYLGDSKQVWETAKKLLDNWQQFPPSWTTVFLENTTLVKEKNVLVFFHLFGLWWVNPARIVYTLDESDRYGFAYGTLEGHVEQGEECFWIEREGDGKIYYAIKAFSKPLFWGARLIYPIARRYQRKFVRESMARMQELTQK